MEILFKLASFFALVYLVYTQCGSCALFQSKDDCLSGMRGTNCKWDKNNQVCLQKNCKDFQPDLIDCVSETDTGNKCYVDPKRGCSVMLNGCSSIQVGCNYTNWCKDTYNGAWCVDEIQFSDTYCFNKVNAAACKGFDNTDETSACVWYTNIEKQQLCTNMNRGTPCKNFKGQQYYCEMMWGCSYNSTLVQPDKQNSSQNGTCYVNDCKYLPEQECTRVRLSQYRYQPCAWNKNASVCIPYSRSLLDKTQCLELTEATWTWSSALNKCVPCTALDAHGRILSIMMIALYMIL